MHLFESLGVVPPPEWDVREENLLKVAQGQWKVGGAGRSPALWSLGLRNLV